MGYGDERDLGFGLSNWIDDSAIYLGELGGWWGRRHLARRTHSFSFGFVTFEMPIKN